MVFEHIAIWTRQLEKMKDFYMQYFNGTPNQKYDSEKEFNARFESYFISFDSGSRLEIMQMSTIPSGGHGPGDQYLGITHLAFSVDTTGELDELTEKLRADGFEIIGEPRYTGDGYYESCVLDPDGNRVEITVVP